MFSEGQVIKTFRSKKGNEVLLRLVKEDDLEKMTSYQNEISREDTFISFSGEILSLEEEKKFIDEIIKKMSNGDAIELLAFVGKDLIGIGGFTRMDRRSKHVAQLGISIKKEYREEGIGKTMMQSLIELAKQLHLQILQLSCFSTNNLACNLYQNLGFRIVGQVPKKYAYKGDFIDEVIMTKSLS